MIDRITDILIEHSNCFMDAFQAEGVATIISIAQTIMRTLEDGGTIYLCGNGGSAADAQHVAGELVGKFQKVRKALAAVALSTDTSILTSIANDDAYENVFKRQVEALVKEGDILWAFSTSGGSDNVIRAIEAAKNQGAYIIAFTGKYLSFIERISDKCFCAMSDTTARSQEIHQIAYHTICELVESHFAENE